MAQTETQVRTFKMIAVSLQPINENREQDWSKRRLSGRYQAEDRGVGESERTSPEEPNDMTIKLDYKALETIEEFKIVRLVPRVESTPKPSVPIKTPPKPGMLSPQKNNRWYE